MPIEESQPLGYVTSSVLEKGNGGALFAVEDHYGAVMTIPQNTLQLWPGDDHSDARTDVALLPQENMVIIRLRVIIKKMSF